MTDEQGMPGERQSEPGSPGWGQSRELAEEAVETDAAPGPKTVEAASGSGPNRSVERVEAGGRDADDVSGGRSNDERGWVPVPGSNARLDDSTGSPARAQGGPGPHLEAAAETSEGHEPLTEAQMTPTLPTDVEGGQVHRHAEQGVAAAQETTSAGSTPPATAAVADSGDSVASDVSPEDLSTGLVAGRSAGTGGTDVERLNTGDVGESSLADHGESFRADDSEWSPADRGGMSAADHSEGALIDHSESFPVDRGELSLADDSESSLADRREMSPADHGEAAFVDYSESSLADDGPDQSSLNAPSGLERPEAARSSRIKQLEREGEVAADFLERLLDIADLDGDIDVDVDGDRAAVAVVDSEEGRVPRRLVGPEGRVLEALQELTRLAVQAATGERSRLMLDVAGFRAERRSTLVHLARGAIAEVKESGRSKALPDMTAFERKVVHDEVTAAGLVSESEGVEPYRHIVIMPAPPPASFT